MAKAKLKNKNRHKTESYKKTRIALEVLIGRVGNLYSDAKNNKDKIAMWTLGYVYEDLIKSYHRLGNIALTVKGLDTEKD